MADNQNVGPAGPTSQPNGIKNLIVKRRKFLIVMAAFALLGATLLAQSDALILRDSGDDSGQSASGGDANSPQLDVNNQEPAEADSYMNSEPNQTTASCDSRAASPTAKLEGYKLGKCADFNGTAMPADWKALSGGSQDEVVGAGRQPGRCSFGDGRAILAQATDGATCGLASDFGQLYGYWEIKMRAFSTGTGGGSAAHPRLLLWPDNNAGNDGVLNFFGANIGDDSMDAVLHCMGSPDLICYQTSYMTDFAEWHVYGFEWRPDGMRGFVDGKEIYTTASKGAQPSKPMRQMIRLDNLSESTPAKPAKMEVDWAHMYTR